MCFNFEASITVWLISVIISTFLYNRNRNYDRWNAGFILIVSTIQLLEAGLWLNLNNENINSLLTKMILLVLLAEPLTQCYLGYKFTNSMILMVLSYVFLGFFIYGIIRCITAKPGQFHTSVASNGKLEWKDGNNSLLKYGWVWMIGMFVPLLFMKNYKGIPLLFAGLITLLMSFYITRGQGVGSLWCYLAIIYAITAIFV